MTFFHKLEFLGSYKSCFRFGEDSKVPTLSVAAGDLENQVQEVQIDVNNKLEKANEKYKMKANTHRQFKSFDVGDEVMVFISKVTIASFNKESIDHTKLLRRSTILLMWLIC